MGIMFVQKHLGLLVFFVFVFSLNNPQLSFSSSSNVTLPNNSSFMLCPPPQSHALLQFISTFTVDIYANSYRCLEDRSYPKTESWRESTDCCSSWDGVTCDDVTGHVIGLDLSCSQLKGTIHSNNTLFSSHIVPHLQSLNLAYNNFASSDISSEFWAMFGSSLTHLNLSLSGFRGDISSEISHLSNLVSLDLSFNGGLGVESDRVLENIARNLTHLRVLNLDYINMSSLRASFLMNLSSSLTSLHLSECGLQGEFPVSFLMYPNLEELDLSLNNFNPVTSLPYLNSTTPTSSNLLVLDLTSTTTFSLSSSSSFLDFVGDHHKSLRHLDLSICNISGSIPPSFGNLVELTHLYLYHNNLSGPIPPSIGNLTQLTHFNLYDNNLSGHIPPSLGNLTQLTHFNLYDNNLSGHIPPSLGNLIELTHFNLYDNNLSGPIPASLGNLTQLTVLDLSSNHLSGPIPTSLSNLAHLAQVDMSENELEGVLPSFLFDLQSLISVSLSYNKLNGPFPPIKSMQLTFLDLSHNNISSSTTTDINISYSLPNFTDLDLSSCNFDQFPAFIKALTNLTFLNISNNQLQGPIPEWIFSVGKETLYSVDFSRNLLTTVGSPIHWKKIEYIDLNSNLLRGSLPILPTTTRFFSVFNNSLSGEVSSVFCNLSSIDFIDLSNNHFTGLIPQCLGRLSHLSVLNMGINNFHGAIPNSFTKNNNLNYLVLRRNNFKGKLPTSLVNCQRLQILDVSDNMIEDTLPYWLDRLSALEILVLRSNKFFGSLNSVKGKHVFPMVRILDLSNNSFTGGLPIRLIRNLNLTAKMGEELGGDSRYMKMLSNDFSLPRFMGYYYAQGLDTPGLYYPMVITVKGLKTEYKKIMTALAIIDLSRNKFEGHIPDMIGKLISLNGLNLSHNLLKGHIPSSMGGLASLEWLDLSSNKLNGQIPNELTNMTFLSVLNLSHNQLDGPIPQGKQFDTFTNDSYKDNLALCGLPLSRSCGLPPSAAPENRGSSDPESGFNWAGASAGYGCGIVLGLSIGYFVFETGTPKWFVRMVDGKKQRGRVGQRSRRSGGRRRHS